MKAPRVFHKEFVLFLIIPPFFSRKTPRDLTEASLSGAGISVVAAISMIFLFGMVKKSPSLFSV